MLRDPLHRFGRVQPHGIAGAPALGGIIRQDTGEALVLRPYVTQPRPCRAKRCHKANARGLRLVGEAVGRINGTYGEASWTPVRYINKAHSRTALAGLVIACAVTLAACTTEAADIRDSQDFKDGGDNKI